ncbi:hypothetical protein [Aeromicrobium ginsengisoli]|uniref:Uncharacterized protein n=1 Tax=Aeromicrobium ginsengisoli TaxID=363867 RepID=A0A5M4FGL6_9ACTN|nr:hypothetical protein [Aeromicrobium ginsengisoli]KAA1399220.1 hypothetical protein ESP70_000125 [Aeromicrobium ginsengisoli]
MVDWEHQPTSGPAVFLGAGIMTALAGASLLWISATSSTDRGLVIFGIAALVAGLCSAGLASHQLLRRRRSS